MDREIARPLEQPDAFPCSLIPDFGPDINQKVLSSFYKRPLAEDILPPATVSGAYLQFGPSPTEPIRHAGASSILDNPGDAISWGNAYDAAFLALGLPQEVSDASPSGYGGRLVLNDQRFDRIAAGIARQYLEANPDEADLIKAEMEEIERNRNRTMLEDMSNGSGESEDFQSKYPHLAKFLNWIEDNTKHLEPQRKAANTKVWDDLQDWQKIQMRRNSAAIDLSRGIIWE